MSSKRPNIARDLAVAIGNVLETAPDAAPRAILAAWRSMANRAAMQIDELNEFNAAIAIPLTDGSTLRMRRDRG